MADRHLVAVLARLTICSSIVDGIRQVLVDDELSEQWFAQSTYSSLVRDTDRLNMIKG